MMHWKRFEKLFIVPIAAILLLAYSGTAQAVPTLQLDIDGGTYDSGTETIITPDSSFTIYAYLNLNKFSDPTEMAAMLADTYYLSIALTPAVDSGAYGSFDIDGTTVDTATMASGTPPDAMKQFDLASHGIFPTYYYDEAFTFSGAVTSLYNTQDRAIDGFITALTGDMYLASFVIDMSALDPDYNLHFDLYNTEFRDWKKGDPVLAIDTFAPFSHDAATAVPEPATVFLLGLGLLGLWGWTKRFGTANIGK